MNEHSLSVVDSLIERIGKNPNLTLLTQLQAIKILKFAFVHFLLSSSN
jgi:hypothetical protein